jgi:hypothetical protein
MLAPTATQLDEILYLEIRQLFDQTGRCLDCRQKDPEGPTPCPHSAVLTGDVGLSARTGIRAPDFRRIFGKTAVRAGNLRGFSGSKVLAIEDESSDIRDELDNALVGNLASADCHRAMISNPDKPYGFFYRAFHEERHLFHQIQQSSEETPNVIHGRQIIPGLASREWLEERARAWGRGSAYWAAHVEGKFPKASQGQLFPLESIKAAQSLERRKLAPKGGRLQLGIDVAGAGLEGDELAFHIRRGDHSLKLVRHRGMTRDEVRDLALELLDAFRHPTDWDEDSRPIVVIDRDGDVGAKAYDTLLAYLQRDHRTEGEFKLVGFQGGQPPENARMKAAYKMNRDLMFAGLVQWMRDGGCLPEDDPKLEGDLLAIHWMPVEGGKSQLEPKSEVRKRLGRSPDSADAVALSVWNPNGLSPPVVDEPAPPAAAPAIDPYRVPSPYG